MDITVDPSRSPRSRTADTTRRALVARYQRSDLTQRAFCERAGIPISTLQWWLVKARREAPPATAITFREVVVPDPSSTVPISKLGPQKHLQPQRGCSGNGFPPPPR